MVPNPGPGLLLIHVSDVGKRILQCHCGAARRNTSYREAVGAGWGSHWIADCRVWHCEVCFVSPRLPHIEHRFLPSRQFLGAARSRRRQDLLDCLRVLDRVCEIDRVHAWIWYTTLLVEVREYRIPRIFWENWGVSRGMWASPMIAQHLAKSVEHYTPPEITGRMREVFGGDIDLDPMSCAQANQLVRAKVFFSESGLSSPWSGNVWLNPPGKSIKIAGEKVNHAAYAWAVMALRFARGQFVQGGYLLFNLETLRYTQGWKVRQPLDFPVCFFKARLDYYRPGRHGPEAQGQPTHPSALVYLGPKVDRFVQVFRDIGYIKK